MANTKNAILRAKIEGVLVDLMLKTNAENVSVGDVTLAAKLAEIIASLGEKATSSELTNAIAALRTELMGEGVPEAYDTFKELADYIATHKEAADALIAAVGNKADKSTVEALQNAVNALGALSKLDKVGESNLDDALKEKVNAASEGNHSHNNKAELDKIAEGDKAKWDAAEGKSHEHTNKAVLDGITQDHVASWNAKAKVYAADATVDVAEGEIFVQLTE